MKKSFKLLFASLAITLGIGAAAVAGVSVHSFGGEQVKKVEAAGASGSLIVKFASNHNWFQSGAKICAYITDNSNSYWTSLQTSSTSTLLYKFDYSVSFTPTKLIWVRMNPAATSGNWNQKWNQTGDLGWNEATYINNGWDNPSTSQWTVSAQVRSSKVPSFGKKTTLSTIGINGDGNPEVSGVVSLEKDEEFKMLAGDGVWSGCYGRPAALANAISGGSQTEVSDQNPNIKCEIAGNYDFYFDTETKRLWISRQDIVDADGWATYFNSNVGCDSTGKTLPTGWTSCATEYGKLSADAKNYVYGAVANPGGDNLGRALATYDHAVRAHSSLTRFIVNSSGTPRAALYVPTGVSVFTQETSTTTIVVVISALLLSGAAVGGYFLLRKKRHQ